MRSDLRFTLALAAAGALALSALSHAQSAKGKAAAGNDKGELWEITMKMEMAGMPMAMPARTQQICMGKNPSDEEFVPQQQDCKVTESKRSGNTHRYKMACTGKNAMTAEGETTHTKDNYSGRMRLTGKMEGQDMDMTQTFSGRKLGECTGTIQNQVAKAQSDHAANMAEMCRKGAEGLATHLFFGPGAMCEAQKADFCAEVSKAGVSARDPAGFQALVKRNSNPESAFASCNQDYASITRDACTRAGETRNLAFIASGNCDDDVKRLGEASCRGRSFTSIESSMRGVCSRYASITRGQGDAAAATARTAHSQAAPAVAPKAPDPMQQGLDAVRKLLPF